jgi:enoyl-CoA hydratase/carnithine racemase
MTDNHATKGPPMAAQAYDAINYEVDGHKATITLNRPEALNALSPFMIGELRAAYDEAETDDNVWLLIVTGTGRAFCTGADLRPVGGAAGGHAAVSPDGQAGARGDQRHLLWRRARLGHHR